ncbi:MAG: KilA-N domain-containing protein, partial [Flavobacteriales bacterium]
SKMNYQIHTDAVKKHIIPVSNYTKDKQWIEYADEADLLNIALFGCTAKEWRESNLEHTLDGKNMRDFSSINELAVLSNLESLNSEFIKNGIDKKSRFNSLERIAKQQLEILKKTNIIKSIKKQSESTYLDEQNKLED